MWHVSSSSSIHVWQYTSLYHSEGLGVQLNEHGGRGKVNDGEKERTVDMALEVLEG